MSSGFREQQRWIGAGDAAAVSVPRREAKSPPIRQPKHRWIADLADGRTFADIGGLWGTVNETVTIASLSGATQATMVDIQPRNSKLWDDFEARCAEFGVTDYETVVADVCDNAQVDVLGPWDVVHCSGILYHVSDPISFVRNIMKLTNEYFIIGSMLIPERIENEAGTLVTPRGMFRCTPLLSDDEMAIIRAHYDGIGVKARGINVGKRPDFLDRETGRVRTGPWWHLFTAETMVEICRLCEADVIDTAITKQGAQNVLCKVRK